MSVFSCSQQRTSIFSERSVRYMYHDFFNLVKRKELSIDYLTCVIKSKAQGSKEFILHAPDHFDLRI